MNCSLYINNSYHNYTRCIFWLVFFLSPQHILCHSSMRCFRGLLHIYMLCYPSQIDEVLFECILLQSMLAVNSQVYLHFTLVTFVFLINYINILVLVVHQVVRLPYVVYTCLVYVPPITSLVLLYGIQCSILFQYFEMY